MTKYDKKKIRNIATIAHVDHGKTTLVDAFLKQTHLFRANQEEMGKDRILDASDLEREKGITITAKTASIFYKDHKINIIDTPGHADFGGEVERTLGMADGALLIVDAQEGTMPQTRFVLKKALELGVKIIVVINKIDKKLANIDRAVSKIQDLFLNLASTEEQLEFPIFYAIGREGKVFEKVPEGDLTVAGTLEGDVSCLLDKVIDYIPAPTGDEEGPFQMQISNLSYDAHQGRKLVGRVNRGTVRVGDKVVIIHGPEEGAKKETGTVKNLHTRNGLAYEEIEEGSAGDIIAISGIDCTAIGGTVCDPEHVEALPKIKISNPSVQVKFAANTSPLAGREGEFVTARQVQERLDKEAEINISLRITKGAGGSYYVAGRGELQLAILIEEMRREGYEFEVGRPEVLFIEEDGVKKEPIEELFISVPSEYQGLINAEVAKRNGEMVNMELDGDQINFEYKILTRNLIGLRSELLTATKGNLALNNYLAGYVEYTVQPELYRKGVLTSCNSGTSIGYAMNTVQERGDLFIEPAMDVYEGMIIGINKYDIDMAVNVTKGRKQSGVRVKHDEITQTALKAPVQLTIDYALTFLAKDELLEVTPKNLRLRKKYLTETARKVAERQKRFEAGEIG